MLEYISMAFHGIWSHKMRSALTMLGIIVGIASIITISSTIMGSNEQIKQNLIGSGNNSVTVRLYEGDYEYGLEYQPIPEGVNVFDQSVLDEISELPQVVDASFFRQRSISGNVFHGNTTVDGGTLYGIDSRYFSVYGYRLKSGRLFTEDDYANFTKTVIVDSSLASSLLQGQEPVGEIIEISGEPFVIVGVVEQGSGFTPVINSIEDYYTYMDFSGGKLFIPESIWPLMYRFDEPQSLAVRAASTEDMTSAGKQATDILNSHISPTNSEIRYKSEDLLEQAKELQDLSRSTNQQLIWIATISLLVGGIGVMNIMLVSVTERTREIGLKKALGARKRVISFQFLVEAGVLTCFGGIFGVIAGFILAFAVSRISQIPIVLSPPVAIIAVVFSFVIGLLFGAMPAAKAANLSPIEALRRE